MSDEQLWTDDEIQRAYVNAFEKHPDANHWALLCWIRDDYENERAKLMQRIDDLELGYNTRGSTIDAMQADIEELIAQLAERAAYEPVPPGDYVYGRMMVRVDAEGFITRAGVISKRDLSDSNERVPFVLCRRKQSEASDE